jgi:hypothetical protein
MTIRLMTLMAFAGTLEQSRALAARKSGRPPEVSVKTIDDDALRGALQSFSLVDGLVLGADDGDARHIPATEVVRINTPWTRSPPSPTDWEMRLSDGEVLFGRLVGSAPETITLETLDLGRVSVSLDDVTRLISPVANTPAQQSANDWFLSTDNAREDAVLLTNGDTARGFVVTAGADGVTLDSGGNELQVPTRLIVALRLATAATHTDEADDLEATITFKNSGRLIARGLRWSGLTGTFQFPNEVTLRFEAERVVRVDVRGGRWEWLPAMQPISEQHTPMLSLPWERSMNRNVLGGPISVGSETFEHGVGVHSRSSLTYDLKGAYREFATYYGMDDESGPLADVTVMIRVDGKPRFEQTGVTRGKLYGPVRLDVAKANRIELVVDFGQNGDIQDRFNWVEPALVK